MFKCYAKIVQTERIKSSLLELYAEVQPILCKDIHYLRDKYDSNHNNSKCACAQFKILALASGKVDYKTHISIPMKVKSILTLNSSTISPHPRPHSRNRRKKRFLGIVFKQAKSVTIHQ